MLCPLDAERGLTAQKKTEMHHIRWEFSETDKGHVGERVELITTHEEGGILCRTRYDASQGDWLR